MIHPPDPDISGKEEEEEEEEVDANHDYLINNNNNNTELRHRNNHQNSNEQEQLQPHNAHSQASSSSPPSPEMDKKQMTDKHDRLLAESKRSVLYFMFCALFTAFLRSSRTNVWILYARLFYTETSENIAWVLYGGTMFSGLSSLLYSSVADYVGFDKMMVILLVLKAIGVLLECVGIDFSLLIIGYLLTSLAVLYVCLSYISWILPHKYAVQYTSYFYAAYFLSYLSGAMLGSILSYYFNYRLIFWVNFMFMLGVVVFSVYFILGIQKKLERKQLAVGRKLYKLIALRVNTEQHQLNTFENREREVRNLNNREYQLVPTHNNEPDADEQDEDEQHVQAIADERDEEEEYEEVYGEAEKLSDVNERFSVVVNDQSNQEKLESSYFWGMRSMTCIHWILLICILIQHAMVLCVDALWILYYNVYIVDRFHGSIITGASQIVVVCVFFALGNLLIPHILTANFCNVRNNKYFVILVCSILLIGMFGLAYPLTHNLDMYWLYSVITGFVSGILSMTMEIIILELQPKEYTGRVNGIKGFTRFFVTANGVLIAGLLWNVTYDAMFYTQAGAHCIELVLILVMISIQMHQKRRNRPVDHFGDQIRVRRASQAQI